MREELIMFFTSKESELADLISDETWCNKISFLADISQALNNLNNSMQRKNENIRICTEKVNFFKGKQIMGSQNKKENEAEIFKLIKCCRLDKILVDLILQNLLLLSKGSENYFPALDASSWNWVRNPLVLREFDPAELTAAQEGVLRGIRNERRLKLKHSSTDTASFCCLIITKKAFEALLPSSYLCEAGFPAMRTMKSKNRSRLQTLEEDLRVCLPTIQPRTRDFMRHHQAQIPH
jgi:hypothetical protein